MQAGRCSTAQRAQETQKSRAGQGSTAQHSTCCHPALLTQLPARPQGTRLLLRERDKPGFLCFRNSYWVVSLFSVRGRAVPWLPLIVYLVYSALVCFAYTKIPGADQLEQFQELHTVTNTIGAPQNAAVLGAPLFVYALVLVARPALDARAGTRRRRLHAGWQLGPPPPPLPPACTAPQ
jgi:hypothetical protein